MSPELASPLRVRTKTGWLEDQNNVAEWSNKVLTGIEFDESRIRRHF
jgi:hypothetical protein